jgi:hypothetical protein
MAKWILGVCIWSRHKVILNNEHVLHLWETQVHTLDDGTQLVELIDS